MSSFLSKAIPFALYAMRGDSGKYIKVPFCHD